MSLKIFLTILVSSSLLAIVSAQTISTAGFRRPTDTAVVNCNNNASTYFDYTVDTCNLKKTIGVNCTDFNITSGSRTYVQISCISVLMCNGTCRCVNDTIK